jgi:hypothetical protein
LVTDERSSDQLNQEREDENVAYLFAAQLMQGNIQGSVKMIRGREQQFDTTSTRPAAAADNKPVSAADHEPAAAVDNEPTAAADNKPTSVADNETAAVADNESSADGDIEPASDDNELVNFRESSKFEDDSEGWTDQEQLEVWNGLQMMGMEYSRGVSGSCDGTAHKVHWRPGFGRSGIGMALSEDDLERKLIGSKGRWKVLAANNFRFAVGNAVTGYHQRALAGEHMGETYGPYEPQVQITLHRPESQF